MRERERERTTLSVLTSYLLRKLESHPAPSKVANHFWLAKSLRFFVESFPIFAGEAPMIFGAWHPQPWPSQDRHHIRQQIFRPIAEIGFHWALSEAFGAHEGERRTPVPFGIFKHQSEGVPKGISYIVIPRYKYIQNVGHPIWNLSLPTCLSTDEVWWNLCNHIDLSIFINWQMKLQTRCSQALGILKKGMVVRSVRSLALSRSQSQLAQAFPRHVSLVCWAWDFQIIGLTQIVWNTVYEYNIYIKYKILISSLHCLVWIHPADSCLSEKTGSKRKIFPASDHFLLCGLHPPTPPDKPVAVFQ